jgi:superfamily I DNA/RNA helicase
VRSLDEARVRARECRVALSGSQAGLLERLEAHLRSEHRVRINAVDPVSLEGGGGEIDVSGSRPRLRYSRELDGDPARKLELFAHEYGHLVLHARLSNTGTPPDPVLGSAYLGEGAAALARYNPRSREEAEADAFATEFVCPADEVFARWRADEALAPEHLAAEMGVSVELVRIQLAEGLYRAGVPLEGGPREPKPETPANEDQETAATRTGVPVLVDAGPGTGKTKTLVRRVVHLLAEVGAAPESLLVLTFSRAAADELRERVAIAAGAETAARIEIATFHEFGMKVLCEHGNLLGLPERFAILDEAAQEDLVARVLGRVPCDPILKLKDLDETAREAARHITFLKDRRVTPEHLAEELASNPATELARALHAVFAAYEAEKAASAAVDFADLILLPTRILDHGELRGRFREKYRWVMVDEYQDVSRAVATLLQRLCGPENAPWVVGDARQAIYRFRGAAPENVTEFPNDFPGAEVHTLALNYRSSAAVVAAANELAAHMAGAPSTGGTWRAATQPAPVRGQAVEVVEVDSDRAEHDVVSARVREWMDEEGASPDEIAVLARRNIDVRNIALALNRAGVRAVTSGLVTSEGAGGDLAAVLALPDAPRAAVPRLIHRLGRGRAAGELNEYVAQVLDGLHAQGQLPDSAADAGAALRRLAEDLQPLRFAGDAWDVLCAFLFGRGGYLRGVLARRDEAEASLDLEEILTALSLALAHRVTRTGGNRRDSRMAFAARLRERLTEAAGSALAGRPVAGSVRVMTCHASKGLEFPFVAVAGQSLPTRVRGYPWLPEALRPPAPDDALQADALLFVGVTRAQRAVSVSYARTASGAEKARVRMLPGLLTRWSAAGAVPTRTVVRGPTQKERVEMGAIWGGTVPATITAYTLASDCAIRTYLEAHLGIDFPPGEASLYPKFIGRCRRAMLRVTELAHERGAPVPAEEAGAILADEWPEDDFAGHPHVPIFRPRAAEWVRSFATRYEPGDEPAEVLPAEVEITANGDVRLMRSDLVARVRTASGTVAVMFRPDLLEPGKRDPGSLTWSSLKETHRLPFVLLREAEPHLRPSVFVGPSGRIFPYRWSDRKPEEGLRKEAEGARAALASQAAGRFEHTVDDFGCDRCRCRVSCPVGSARSQRNRSAHGSHEWPYPGVGPGRPGPTLYWAPISGIRTAP